MGIIFFFCFGSFLSAIILGLYVVTAYESFDELDGRKRMLSDGQTILEIPIRSTASAGRNLSEPQLLLSEMHLEPDGVYWTKLKIGKEFEQSFSVIVDTGSATIALPCHDCKKCGTHNLFQLTNDSKKLKSSYHQCYAEQSCNYGDMIRAPMCLGDSCDINFDSVDHDFGCCNVFAPAFQKQEADGIMGISGGKGTLLADLRSHHKLEKDMFSLCLSTSGGVLGIGGYDANRHLEPIQWITLSFGPRYEVQVSAFHVLGNKVDVSQAAKALVDSGNTYTYVPHSVFRELKKHFHNFCEKSDFCEFSDSKIATIEKNSLLTFRKPNEFYDLQKWLDKFPPVEIEFADGVKYCIPSGAYTRRSQKSSSNYFIAIRGGTSFVLGASTMVGFDYVFDHASSRLGIARSLCLASSEAFEIRPSTCCGSCASSQEKENIPGNAQPSTLNPGSVPKNNSAKENEYASEESDEDGFFMVKSMLSPSDGDYGALIIYYPIKGSAWTTGKRTFHANEALVVSEDANICNDSMEEIWHFEDSSRLIIRGDKTRVEIGRRCRLASLYIEKNAEVSITSSEITTLYNQTPPVHIFGTLHIFGVMRLPSYSHLELVESSAKAYVVGSDAILNLSPFSLITCENVSLTDDQLFVKNGARFFISAPATCACNQVIEPDASVSVHPDPESKRPVIFNGTTTIQGMMELVFLRSPFVSFSVLAKGSINWDSAASPVLSYRLQNVSSEENYSMLVSNLPSVSRAMDGTLVNIPSKVQLSPELRCANVNVDEKYPGQLYFPAADCLNKCINSTADLQDGDVPQCSDSERNRDTWPQKDALNDRESLIDGFDKFVKATYDFSVGDRYDEIFHHIGLDSGPISRFSTALGLAVGAICGLIVAFFCGSTRKRML